MQQQQAEYERFKQINPHMVITWDIQRRTHISLSESVVQNYSADSQTRLNWIENAFNQSAFNLDQIQLQWGQALND